MEPAFDRELTIENLRRHVDRLAGLIGPRHVGKPQALAAAALLVENEFRGAGYEVQRESYAAAGVNVDNLVAERTGSRRRDEILLLGAHYDTIPETPGADDNASAVAVLIEVARTLHELRPQRTVRFVGFLCEEPPHFHTGEMGSQIYARRCRERKENIVGMLCLEMVGYFSTQPGSQQIPESLPRWSRALCSSRGDFLAAVGNLRSWRLLWQFRRGFKRATRMPLLSLALPERIHEIRLSDNSSFWDQGYALMLTDTSFLRNPNYHRDSDTPETLDYERMADMVRGVAGAIRFIAGVDR